MRRLYQLALALLPLLAACEANCPIHCVHTVTRYEGPMRGNVQRCAECGGECREGRK